jgi:putative endonuclease
MKRTSAARAGLTMDTSRCYKSSIGLPLRGAVAQLGARLDGIEEVVGSNPIGSTNTTSQAHFFVYILQSETTGRYYIGQTKNLDDRVAYHNANYSRALKNRGPWTLVYFETYATRSQAMRRENYIKRQKNRRFIDELRSASR